MYKKIAVAVTSFAMALTVGVFSSPLAYAGGSGDFYKSDKCYGKTAGGAVLFWDTYMSVSNYDYGTGQQYHFGMRYHKATIAYKPHAIYIDGVKWGGSLTEAYKNYSNKSSVHTFKAQWRAAGLGYLSCSIRL